MKKIRLDSSHKGTVALVAIGLLFIISYGYRCGFQKICGPGLVERVVRDGKELTFPQGKIVAEVASTPASRELGLSGRSGLKEGKGMLFVFEHSGRYGFWMKDMNFPIDIIWINEDGVVVHIERGATPESYSDFNPPKTFVNTPDAKYVLEIASGASDTYGIYLGTKVQIED
ncbi:MAG: DUF192 domain-containing protein [Candidatus Paceibacterota bacterium]